MAAPPVRGAPNLRHQKVRTPYLCPNAASDHSSRRPCAGACATGCVQLLSSSTAQGTASGAIVPTASACAATIICCSVRNTFSNSGREEGCAQHCAISRSNGIGTPAGGGRRRPSSATFLASSPREMPSKGVRHVRSSQVTTPKLQISHLWL
eukprot:1260488-Prymnesium_polylepis.2